MPVYDDGRDWFFLEAGGVVTGGYGMIAALTGEISAVVGAISFALLGFSISHNRVRAALTRARDGSRTEGAREATSARD